MISLGTDWVCIGLLALYLITYQRGGGVCLFPTLFPIAANLSLAHAGGTTIPNAYWVPAPVSLYDSQIHEPWGGPKKNVSIGPSGSRQLEQDRR